MNKRENIKMPIWMGWVAGLFVFAFLFGSLDWLAGAAGLPTYVDYDETVIVMNRYYEEEIDGHQTALGWWILFVSISAGTRMGMAAVKRDWNGGVKPLGNLQLAVFFIGLSIYALIMTTVWQSFPREVNSVPAIVRNGLEVALAAGIGYLCYLYYQSKRIGLEG